MKQTIFIIALAILAFLASFFGVGLVVFLWLLWPALLSVPVWLALKVLLPLFTAVKVSWLQTFCGLIIVRVLRSFFLRPTLNNTTTKES